MDYDFLQLIKASGFQESDEDHPAGQGKTGYRTVFKTLKVIPRAGLQMQWSNLQIRFLLNDISRGGISVEGAMQSRRQNIHILPEELAETRKGKSRQITGKINMKFGFKGWQETLKDSACIEILYITETGDPAQAIEEGRLRTAKIKMLLELLEGTRILGIPYVEEVVEIFPDWQWNRNMSSFLVGTESELNLADVDTHKLKDELDTFVTYINTLSPAANNRINRACTWFWKAESELDKANRLIEYWTCIEALELTSPNIGPIKRKLAQNSEVEESKWASYVGRIATIRSELVHGNRDHIDDSHLMNARLLALALLHFALLPKESNPYMKRMEETIKV